MTNECRIINGRVIVNGDKGLQERNYTENLTQLIKLENQRDLLLKKIEEIEERQKTLDAKPRKSTSQRILGIFLRTLGLTGFVGLMGVLFSLVFHGDVNILGHLLQGANSLVFGVCVVSESTGLLLQFLCEKIVWSLENERAQESLSCQITIDCLKNSLTKVSEALNKCSEEKRAVLPAQEGDYVDFVEFNSECSQSIDEKTERLMNLMYWRENLLKFFEPFDEQDSCRKAGYEDDEIAVAKKHIMQEVDRQK